MRTLNIIILSIIVSASLLQLSFSAITGPKTSNKPIRLSSSKRQIGKIKSNSNNVNRERKLSGERPNDQRKQPLNNPPAVKLNITEPPNDSFIAGEHFMVSISIITDDEESFRKAYVDGNSGRVCLSLDEGAYSCWPVSNGRVFFSQVVEGSHSLVAKIYKDGKLIDQSISSVNFTTVINPSFYDPNTSYHNQLRHQEIREEAKDSGEGAHVSFPIVDLMSPLEKVSYHGTSIELQSRLRPKDPEMFEKFFNNSYICFNVDIATAHACFPIFGDATKPLILGLESGMHTIEASLCHPHTGDLLLSSSSGTIVFFMAGDSNEGAAFTANVNIRGKSYEVPVVKGGCITTQAKNLCSSVGLADTMTCFDSVHNHLKEVAAQSRFFIE